jgi:hypothetical protein
MGPPTRAAERVGRRVLTPSPLRLVVGTGYSIGLSRREAEAAWEEGKR